jgi:hypothetical protein
MEGPKINWEININTMFQMIVVIGGLLMAYGSFTAKYDEHLVIIKSVQEQTTRIEKYLSSKDPNYWKDSKDY